MSVCRIQNLKIEIENTTLIEGLSYEVEAGKKHFIFGQIGIGKSLLLDSLAGLRAYQSGNVDWNQNLKYSYLFQKNALLPWLTVSENLKMISPDFLEVEDMFSELQIDKLLTKKASVLSGGETQKVNFYRALVCRPDVIFADEPFNSLDQNQKKTMYRVFDRYSATKQSTVFWVSHDLLEVVEHADQVWLFSKKNRRLESVLKKENISIQALSDFLIKDSD